MKAVKVNMKGQVLNSDPVDLIIDEETKTATVNNGNRVYDIAKCEGDSFVTTYYLTRLTKDLRKRLYTVYAVYEADN